MLRIHDGCRFSWSEDGLVLFASAATASIPTPIDDTRFALLETCYRQEPSGGATIDELGATLGGDGRRAAESVEEMLAAGIIEDTSAPTLHDAFYPPMLYYHMLADTAKMLAYKEALARAIRPGMRVLHAGCGLGIFAIWAAKLGARRVWAMDQRSIVRAAEDLASENGVSDVVSTVKGDLFDSEISARIGDVDVIVSEFIGDEIFDEDILRKSYWLRQCYSSSTAPLLIPAGIEVFGVPVRCPDARAKVDGYDASVPVLEKQYDLTLKAAGRMIARASRGPDLAERLYVSEFHEYAAEELVEIGPPQKLVEFDLTRLETTLFRASVPILVTEDGPIDGMLLFFRAALYEDVVISSLQHGGCHWPQLLFLTPSRRGIQAGESVRVSMAYLGAKRFLLSLT